MARKSRRRRNLKTVLTDLPDALIVEILSRLPFKSLCCCKCIGTHWRYLISNPENLKKLPQTLAGFFFDTEDKGRSPKVARHFANVDEGPEIFFEGPEIDPGFSFLPPEFELIKLEDCCDGLLLCCSSQHPFRRLVCNPATERWVVLPSLPADSSCVAQEDTFHLAFDRDVSSHFHVFQIVLKEWWQVAGIYIYSSGAGSWSFKESGWDSNTSICHRHVFHQGMLHFVSFESTIVSVDVEGKKWRAIPVPEGVERFELGFLGRSQGHLHYMACIGYHVSIWSLEKYDSDEWTLKYSVSNNNLVNARGTVYGYEYNFISCHPDRSLICYVNCRDNTLMAYDTDREEARVLCSVGRGSLQSCFPYVALFNDSSVPLSS